MPTFFEELSWSQLPDRTELATWLTYTF